MDFIELSDALYYMNTHGLVIAAELSENSVSLTDIHIQIRTIDKSGGDIFVIVGNEVTGVEQETLHKSDIITHIPMLGIKESLNVGQAAAIIMWELS
jgi:tRNA G18 (ribose-2'-O)-methylase SpoU